MTLHSSRRNAALLIFALFVQAGCARTPETVTPAPDIRQQFGQIGVVAVPAPTVDAPRAPDPRTARNVGRAMLRGAGAGFVLALHSAKAATNEAAAVVVLAALIVAPPAGALIGGITAGVAGRSPKTIRRAGSTIRGVLEEARIGESVRDHLTALAAATTEYRLVGRPASAATASYRALAAKGDTTVLEIYVTRASFKRQGNRQFNPRVRLVITVQARLVRTADDGEIARRSWQYDSRPYKYFTWARRDGRALRAELQKAYAWLGERILEDLLTAPPKRRALSGAVRSGRLAALPRLPGAEPQPIP